MVYKKCDTPVLMVCSGGKVVCCKQLTIDRTYMAKSDVGLGNERAVWMKGA